MTRSGVLAGLAVVALLVAGCGGADTGTPVATGPETTSVSTTAPTTTIETPADSETPAEPETPVCVEDSVVQDALASLPSFNGSAWKVSDQGDPCATLSWVDAKIEGSMAASPKTILFFHDNTYLGTATAKTFSFTTVDSQTDDTVTVSYRWLRDGEATSQLSGGPALIRYHWNGSSVDMLDQLPVEVTG